MGYSGFFFFFWGKWAWANEAVASKSELEWAFIFNYLRNVDIHLKLAQGKLKLNLAVIDKNIGEKKTFKLPGYTKYSTF